MGGAGPIPASTVGWRRAASGKTGSGSGAEQTSPSPEFSSSSSSSRKLRLRPNGLEAARPALRQDKETAIRPLRRSLAAAAAARVNRGLCDDVTRT